MIEKKIKVRKEVVRCDICKQPKDFLYLSDFAYGQRLVYFYDNVKPAFINLLEDEVFLEYVEMVKNMLDEHNISFSAENINIFIDKSFGVACDTIYGKRIDFCVGQKKCIHCGSTKFERNMIEPECMLEIDLPIVTHEKWKSLDNKHKENIILNELKKEGMLR